MYTLKTSEKKRKEKNVFLLGIFTLFHCTEIERMKSKKLKKNENLLVQKEISNGLSHIFLSLVRMRTISYKKKHPEH